jgi:hypothetical protein
MRSDDYQFAGSVLLAASAPDWTGFGVDGAEAGGGGFEAHGMEIRWWVEFERNGSRHARVHFLGSEM